MSQIDEDFPTGQQKFRRSILAAQVLLTAAILAWVPGNLAKLAVMLVVWTIGFRCLTRAEIILAIGTNIIFAGMDIATLHRGSFRFSTPDLLGLPYYEFLIWGFYVLNAIRFWGADPPHAGSSILAGPLVLLFALSFSLIQDYRMLFLATGIVLVIGIAIFHRRRDLAFCGYMVAMGTVIEYAGVLSGQWRYDGPALGGVPLWFATMWGGIGLFIHRLWLPLLRWLSLMSKQDYMGGNGCN